MAVNYTLAQTNEIKDTPNDFSIIGVPTGLMSLEPSDTSTHYVRADFFTISGFEPYSETTDSDNKVTRTFKYTQVGINMPDGVDEVYFQDTVSAGGNNNTVKIGVSFRSTYFPTSDTNITLDIDGDAQPIINLTQPDTPNYFNIFMVPALPSITGITMPANGVGSSDTWQVNAPENANINYNPPCYCHINSYTLMGDISSNMFTATSFHNDGSAYWATNYSYTENINNEGDLATDCSPSYASGLSTRRYNNVLGSTQNWSHALGDGDLHKVRFIFHPSNDTSGEPSHSMSRHNFSFTGGSGVSDDTAKTTTYSNPIVFLGYQDGFVQTSDVVSSVVIRDVASESDNIYSWPTMINSNVPDVTQSDMDILSTYGLSPYDWVNNKVEVTLNGLEDYVPGENPPDIYIIMDIKPMLLSGDGNPSVTYDLNININGETE